MEIFFQNVNKCEEAVKNFYGEVEFVSIQTSYSKADWLSGVWFSHKPTTTEAEVSEKNYQTSVHLIHKNREISFVCLNINDLESMIKQNFVKMQEFSEDQEIVIPISEQAFCHDKNLFSTELSLDQIFAKTEDFIKKHNRLTTLIAEISVEKTYGIHSIINSQKFQTIREKCVDSISLSLITEHHHEKFSTGEAYRIKDLSKLEKDVKKTLVALDNQLGSKPISSQDVSCIFSNKIVSRFFDSWMDLISGPLLDQQASCYKDSLQKQVLPRSISVIERPQSEFWHISYDCEGTKLAEKQIVTEGVLQTFLLNSRHAKKLHMKKTGNAFGGTGITSVFIESNEKFNLATFENGAIVTEIISQNFNTTKGEFKATCSGLLIKDFQKFPFNNAVICFTMEDLLKTQLVDDEIFSEGDIFTSSLFFPTIKISGT